jgi:hypothetical protein
MILTRLDLADSMAPPLSGVQMVQSGVRRAYGRRLRRPLGCALGGR